MEAALAVKYTKYTMVDPGDFPSMFFILKSYKDHVIKAVFF